jgi:leucyl aminopeptidase (aminopeptidase T)
MPTRPTSTLDLRKLISDVFAPVDGEAVTVFFDTPTRAFPDTKEWQDRRQMAVEWRSMFSTFKLKVNPPVSFPATGCNNGDLPSTVNVGSTVELLEDVLSVTNIAVAMTTFSASAPLLRYARQNRGFRAASMPGVTKAMEGTALTVDHHRLQTKVKMLRGLLNAADAAVVEFTTGHIARFDLRHRARAMADAGECHGGGENCRFINLPSGEAFIVPYEGEISGDPSLTAGQVPHISDGKLVVFHLENNKIIKVTGDETKAATWARFFLEDPARAHVAEVGLGCNDKAIVTGVVLEDEKAGFHWAYGRNDHFNDGHCAANDFQRSENVIHKDVVYAKGSPIEINRLTLLGGLAGEILLIENGEYLCW